MNSVCDTVALWFFSQCAWCKGLFISLRWKVGLWVERLSLKKKKSGPNYLLCRATSPVLLRQSVQCAQALTCRKQPAPLDYDGRWKDPNLQGPPLPLERLLVQSFGEVCRSSLSSPGRWLARTVCHGYNRVCSHTTTMKAQRERLQIPGLTLE